jgi:glycerol-1-phosphate dehydrogenase [NAD(P)+]
MSLSTSSNDELLQAALAATRDTKCLRVGHGVRHEAAEVFAGLYGSSPAILIADDHTFQAAGRDVYDSLQRIGQPILTSFILHDPNLYAEYRFVEQIRDAIAVTEAIPIAVGAGTISDLTKLAAHQCGRPYITVATAASMDGYTAFGASITFQGSKQTFDCPAAPISR